MVNKCVFQKESAEIKLLPNPYIDPDVLPLI